MQYAVEESLMAKIPLDDDARLKQLLTTALLEVLEERKDLLREAMEQALEDVALSRAGLIKGGVERAD